MKTAIITSFLALCTAGCARTAADKEWAQWRTLQIQSEVHGTFLPGYFVMTAKEYLKIHQIAVDDEKPIVDVEVGTSERMGFVKFRKGAEHICAVEIGPDGKAVRHHDIRVAR